MKKWRDYIPTPPKLDLAYLRDMFDQPCKCKQCTRKQKPAPKPCRKPTKSYHCFGQFIQAFTRSDARAAYKRLMRVKATRDLVVKEVKA